MKASSVYAVHCNASEIRGVGVENARAKLKKSEKGLSGQLVGRWVGSSRGEDVN